MRPNRKKYTILIRLSAVFAIVSLLSTATPASAGLFGGGAKMPSASEIASQLERRYHLDLGSIQNQGEMLNVADNKRMVPEVSLFFTPSDPKPGEKITAKALPIYFSNNEKDLYYTWYLKRDECDLDDSPSESKKAECDFDENDKITVNDWKIEAMRTLVKNGYDHTTTEYDADTDDDGYKARYGGDNKRNVSNYCYAADQKTGIIYELAEGGSVNFTCPAGTSAVCMEGAGQIDSGTDGQVTFEVSDTETCYVSGLPACSETGTPICHVGTPRCVANPSTTTSCGSALNECSATVSSSVKSLCAHLFPEPPGGAESGDGSFGRSEEEFWETDPRDPDTADNGNKDEANVVGLGQSSFTWNYFAGDQVGVAVEGTSMIPTKHDNSSYMIMWAFPKKECKLETDDEEAYLKSIKGYNVQIPTIDFDLNECIEDSLVDPTEGGQATRLEVSVSTTPSNPINDETNERAGDTIVAQASVSNAQRKMTDILYDWKVQISDNMQFSDKLGDVADVTSELRDLGLLSNSEGNGLDSIALKMNIRASASSMLGGKEFSSYLAGGIGYLRFSVDVSEGFSNDVFRKGRSDVIVKFSSTGRKISAYIAEPHTEGSPLTRVKLPSSPSAICNLDPLDRSACRVIKNEVIGLRVDDDGLSNFNWTINGTPLSCSATTVSPDCADGKANHINFFPVTGDVGDTYTVTVTAVDIATDKALTLSRTFHIVNPLLEIESKNQTTAWKKFLGQYRDLSGTATACPTGWCDDYSSFILQAFEGGNINLSAKFTPNFLRGSAAREWYIDGFLVQESAPGEISFTATKPASGVYTVNLAAQIVQSDEMRRALLDIWGVSPFDSLEINFSGTSQIELQSGDLAQGPIDLPRKYYAAVASYLPSSALFTLRMLLSAFLILFVTGFLSSLVPEPIAPRERSSRE